MRSAGAPRAGRPHRVVSVHEEQRGPHENPVGRSDGCAGDRRGQGALTGRGHPVVTVGRSAGVIRADVTAPDQTRPRLRLGLRLLADLPDSAPRVLTMTTDSLGARLGVALPAAGPDVYVWQAGHLQ